MEKNVRSWNKLSTVMLQVLLHNCEPHIYHEGTFAKLVKRGKKHETMKTLLEHLEFVTSLSPTSRFTEEQANGQCLLKTVMLANEKNGRRAMELRLPTAWEKQGVYLWRLKDDGSLELSYQHSSKSCVVPMQFPAGTQFSIENNFSEQTAWIYESSGSFDAQVVMLFAKFAPVKDVGLSTSQPALRQRSASASGAEALAGPEADENITPPCKKRGRVESPHTGTKSQGSESAAPKKQCKLTLTELGKQMVIQHAKKENTSKQPFKPAPPPKASGKKGGAASSSSRK